MAQTAMTVRMDNQQKAQFDKLCEQFGMSRLIYDKGVFDAASRGEELEFRNNS